MTGSQKPFLLNQAETIFSKSDSGLALQRNTELARAAFREVWRDFYARSQAYSREAILSLKGTPRSLLYKVAVADPACPDVHVDSPPPTVEGGRKPDDDRASEETCLRSDAIQLTVYNMLDSPTPVSTNLHIDSIDAPDFEPHSPYEACSPAPVNILHGDDPNEMPFAPFADDPSFNIREHILEYKSFAWSVPQVDHDYKAIALETAYRLQRQHSISPAEVDDTNILKVPLHTTSEQEGLLRTALQRDYPKWPASLHQTEPPLSDRAVPPVVDLHARLQDYLTFFCPNLNCMEAYCFTHETEEFTLDLSNEKLLLMKDATMPSTPCGSDCFLMNPAVKELSSNFLGKSMDTENLRVVLSVSPDASPCDLAIILRTPCKDVYFSYQSLKQNILNETKSCPKVRMRSKVAKHTYEDTNPSRFTPVPPCRHSGPCSVSARCECFSKKTHCERNCHCSPECPRRWRGCKCREDKPLGARFCEVGICPCQIAGRECDPEICVGYPGCRNSELQHGLGKHLSVRPSKWGQGVFLEESAKAGDFLCEYIGELIYEPTVISRDQVARHRGRNYVYGLNSMLNNDGTYAGNASRFINHAPAAEANCVVRISLVNGDHRVGIYANGDIPRDAELFLDYGPQFFTE